MYFPIIDVLKENFIAKIPSIVTQWLTDNVDPVGSAVVVDTSLSISGAAADAKITGDEISDLKSDLLTDEIKTALIDLFESVAYVDSDGQDKIDALKVALGVFVPPTPGDELTTYFNSLTYLGGKSIGKTAASTYLVTASARMAMSEPIANNNYVFYVVDSTKYSISVYDILSLTPTGTSQAGTPTYQGGQKASAWQTTSDSVTTQYCWVAFKKNDGSDFTAEEIMAPCGTIFTVSSGS